VASIPRAKHVVTLVHAAGCHLCESARRVIEGVRTEVPFELEEVDITGDEAFTYFVHPDGLRRRLGSGG
jgi:hypothetical protein